MALNAEIEKRWWLWMPNWEWGWLWTPKTEKRWWLWTPRLKVLMALNAKTENANGSRHRKWEENNDSERWDWDYDSGCRTETTALNAKRKITVAPNAKWKASNGSERQTEESDVITLNVDPKSWLWTPNWNGGPKRQNETMALNAKPNWTTMNVKLIKTTLNVVTRKIRSLWTSNCKGMMGEGGNVP